MDPIEIIKIMGEMGFKFFERDLDKMIAYIMNMIKDERVIVINNDSQPYSVAFFSITDSVDEFLIKDTWDYKPHHPEGKIIYVEKIVSKGWDKDLRRILEHTVRTKYPQLEYGVWHRYAKQGDRMVMTKRRLINV